MPNSIKANLIKQGLSSLAFQKRNLPWVLIAVVVIGLDLATKAWVTSHFSYGQRLEVLPVFDLVLLHNTGAAFSFLAESSGWQRWFFVGIAVVASLIIWGWLNRLESHEKLTALALALILGGALGNLHDRFFYGYVVDFLAFHWQHSYFPAFNLADSAITLGAMLLIWGTFFGAKGKSAQG
ncbi:signal peptidase II [Marinospirillum insulare]|uniref:Lipoprotein signal peptidase n=1 Tax=Marinospirillum insulare TaxID=217169 RepID=A0ABQ6A1I4_9GAMM|nr:signal peptidase II [Marinospirillum insulare]GLR65130.1 lipoprotein signal peptidase [Marinospirillum insulare]